MTEVRNVVNGGRWFRTLAIDTCFLIKISQVIGKLFMDNTFHEEQISWKTNVMENKFYGNFEKKTFTDDQRAKLCITVYPAEDFLSYFTFSIENWST